MQKRTKKTEYIILAIILLTGLLLRGSYLLEITKNPDFGYPTIDAALNDHWARGIADNNWYVRPGGQDPKIRSTPYFQPPGYAYFLSLIYMSSGSSYLAARIVQMALGLINCVLAYLLGRSMFGRATGLILAGLMSVYWIFIYFEGELLAPSLVIFGSLIMMHVLFLWINKFSYSRGIAAGITIGILALVRTNVLLFIPAVLVWAWWLSRRKNDGRRFHTVTIGFLAGCLITICPVTIRNYRVANDFVPISTNAGINLYMGNNEEANGHEPHIPNLMKMSGLDTWTCFDYPQIAHSVEKQQGREMKYSEVSSYFTDRALDYICKNPGKTLKLTLKKILLFWGHTELPNNKELNCAKIQSATLRFLPGFSAAAASGGIGLLMLICSLRQKQTDSNASDDHRQRRQETSVLVVLFIACCFASYIPFFVTARFRVAIIPFLLLFGAYGIFRIYQYITNHNTKKAACWLLAGIGLFLLGQIPIIPYQPDWVFWHNHRCNAYMLKEQFDLAVEECRKAININQFDARAHHNLAKVLNESGKTSEAITHSSKALQIKPDFMEARIDMAQMYHTQKQYDLALEHLFIALKLNPNYEKVYNGLGETYLSLNQFDQAIKQLNKSIEIDPEQFDAYRLLGRLYYQQKNYEQAFHYAQKALSINPDQFIILNRLGALYYRQKKPEKAIESFKKSLEIKPEQPDVMNELAVGLYGQGKVQQAITLWQDALAIDPEQFYAANSLGLIKATSKENEIYDPTGALKFARQACELTGYKHPGILDTLAAALAANGQFEKAAETAVKALEIAKAAGQTKQAQSIQQHLDLYKKRKARRE
jgi:tetratricopeptide (TPR) repeat protein